MRQRALLARLLLEQGRVVSVDSLVAEVWDGRPPRTARTQVSICVAALRKLFRGAGCTDEVIETVQPGYRLNIAGHRVDTVEFAREVESGYSLGQEGRLVEAAEVLKGALRLWRGPALSDVPAQFAETAAVHLSEQRLLATEQLMTIRTELGEHRAIIGELSALLHAHPLREQLRATLMRAQYRAGQRAEALRTFREGRALSIDELGLEPGALLQALHDAILNDTVPAPSADLHSVTEPVVAPSELPLNAADITGRHRELRALDDLLAQTARRRTAVCFISGSPGIGKTALAVHWGRENARHFPDGQLYVDLREAASGSPERTALTVLQRFLRSLGVHHDHMPQDLGECSAAYRSTLADRRVLVIIDNAASFSEVEPLLPGGGQCCVLVAGLERFMHSRGATDLRLGPIGHADSVALLASIIGADRITAESEAVHRLLELCARLPLAIRAAGVRLENKPHWRIVDLVDRLADPERRLETLSHGETSLRDCFDRAVRRLPPDIAATYQALSVIPGDDFDVRTASEVLHTSVSDAEDRLERLVDLNLLEAGRRMRSVGCLSYRYAHLLRLHAGQLPAEQSLEAATLRLTNRIRRNAPTARVSAR
ncbi:AfsR/SARP family transcriptional regulator [Streptomyces qaidamensis]|uniref:AfsR/SARP family transcriptional regulator n=1 Tax=Streptomyces qaidamensis TaxID=1783515 RepID=UPI00131E5C12|nr:AfsR/SARP family transcriptional regulator [Streptomyces qaidamensis]